MDTKASLRAALSGMREIHIHRDDEKRDLLEARLRAACETLVRMPPSAMRSISEWGSLPGFPEESWQLAVLVDDLATEYGIEATVEVNGSRFTVRFYRGDGALPDMRGD